MHPESMFATTPSHSDHARPPWPAGAPILRNLVDDTYRLRPHLDQLNIRLRDTFLYRPWPQEVPQDRIIPIDFVPPVSNTTKTGGFVLRILDDKHIDMAGTPRKFYGGQALHIFNLYLLTRDWFLRSEDLLALGFLQHKASPADRMQRLRFHRAHLRKEGLPHRMIDGDDGIGRLSSAITLVDERPVVRGRDHS